MTIYYKGWIVIKKNIKFKKLKFYSSYFTEENKNNVKICSNSNYELTTEENTILLKSLIDMDKKRKIEEKTMWDIFDKLEIHNIKLKRKEMNIIFEKIIDKDGNIYGKERLTGYIFPLFNKSDFKGNGNYSFKKDQYDNTEYLDGYLDFVTKLRDNVGLCDCYLVEEGVANINEICKSNKILEHWSKNERFKNKLLFLSNMNVFDESIFDKNSNKPINTSTTVSNSNSNSTPVITTPSVNLVTNSPLSLSNNIDIENSQSITTSINPNNSDESSLIPINTQLEWLEKFKNIINSLTEEDIAQLKDMTKNNLNNPNIFKYILMSKKERLEILNFENESEKKDKPKVSLKKKKTNK